MARLLSGAASITAALPSTLAEEPLKRHKTGTEALCARIPKAIAKMSSVAEFASGLSPALRAVEDRPL